MVGSVITSDLWLLDLLSYHQKKHTNTQTCTHRDALATQKWDLPTHTHTHTYRPTHSPVQQAQNPKVYDNDASVLYHIVSLNNTYNTHICVNICKCACQDLHTHRRQSMFHLKVKVLWRVHGHSDKERQNLKTTTTRWWHMHRLISQSQIVIAEQYWWNPLITMNMSIWS